MNYLYTVTTGTEQWKSTESWVAIGGTLFLCVVAFAFFNRKGSVHPGRKGRVRTPTKSAPAPVASVVASTNPAPLVAEKPIVKLVYSFKEWWQAAISTVIHLIIVGGTNAGKTFLVRKVLDGRVAAGHMIMICDPHARKNRDKWGVHTEQCVGFGRNFTEIEAALLALLKEMNARYNMDTNPYPITVVIEETPALRAKCPSWKVFIEEMAFEARKTDIHLIVVAQSDQVQSLGIEGKGDLRNSLSFIRLGSKSGVPVPAGLSFERYGSFQSQELDGVERVIDLTSLNKVPSFEWPREMFWVPASFPVVKPISIVGDNVLFGVRTPDQIRNGETVEWPVDKHPTLKKIEELGEGFLRLHEALLENPLSTNAELAEAVFSDTDIDHSTASAKMRIGKMKKKLSDVLSANPTLDVVLQGEELSLDSVRLLPKQRVSNNHVSPSPTPPSGEPFESDAEFLSELVLAPAQ